MEQRKSKCLYHNPFLEDESCLPPDEYIPQIKSCAGCKHYLEYLNPDQCQQIYQWVYQGYYPFAINGKEWILKYPDQQSIHRLSRLPKTTKSFQWLKEFLSLSLFTLEDLTQPVFSNAKEMEEKFTLADIHKLYKVYEEMHAYSNMDVLSQISQGVPTWQLLFSLGVSMEINNMETSHHPISLVNARLTASIFDGPLSQLPLVTLQLIHISLFYKRMEYYYQRKELCKECLENGKEAFLHPRQRYCQDKENHQVKDASKREIRHYSIMDRDGFYILDHHWRVYSIMSWMHHQLSKSIESKNRMASLSAH